MIAKNADGDARVALNIYEILLQELKSKSKIDENILKNIISRKVLIYDKNGQDHYNMISALHKSMRNSDENGAAY